MNRLFLYFCLVAGIYLFPLKTTGQQIPMKAEMQEEINELKKEIRELEEEIRELEKSDPTEAEMLKSQLSTLKSMLEMLDKTTKPASRTISSPPAVNSGKSTLSPSPPVRSPLVPVVLKQPVTIPPPSQIKDKLLWYKGKKINDTTLITGTGMVVQYSQKKNMVKLQPEKKTDPFSKIVQEIEKNKQRKEELVDRIDLLPNGFLYYPQLQKALEMYDKMADEYGNLVKNTVELPALPDFASPGKTNSPSGRGPDAGDTSSDLYPEEENLESISQYFRQKLERAKKLISELTPVGEFPPPPAYELGMCMDCDPKAEKRKENQDKLWFEKYSGKESEILMLLLEAERAKALLNTKSVTKDTTDYFNTIGHPIVSRIKEKNKLLYSRYGKDIRYKDNVYRTILGFERQIQLLGREEEISMSTMGEIMNDGKRNYEKYFDEQAEVKNHDFVLNLASHFGMARQAAMFGTDEDASYLDKLLGKFLKYNRFGLTAEIDFIYEQRTDGNELDFKATGKLETSVKQFVMLYPNGCRFKVQPYNTDFQKVDLKDISIPFKVISGVKTIREEEGKLVNYPYTGPGEYPLLFPDFSIDFCDSSKPDSAWFLAFTGNEDAVAMAQAGMNQLNKSYKTDMIPFANFVFFQDDQIEQNEVAINNLGMDMMKAVTSFQTQSPATTKLGRMQQSYEGKTQMDDYRKEMQGLMTSKKSLVLFTANNRSTVLIDKYNDSKRELEEGVNLTRGMLHLRVVHQPID